MSDIAAPAKRDLGQIARYGVNGLVATAVHYSALRAGIDLLHIPSAGAANLLAAVFGISASFIGSRYFVFRKFDESALKQASRFILLYAAIAAVHAGFLFVWTDKLGLDYQIGFAIAMVFQVVGSYFGNRILVFS